jgi:hypothetical protein
MKLTKQKLEEIIKEELSNLMEGGYAGHYGEESLNPEWDQADKILSDLVRLADALERSKDSEPDVLAFAVVRKLRSAVDAMEARLNEKFATPGLAEGAEPIHKIVSRDGKKKGVKVSGNWKDPNIKVKWLDAEGKFGKTVAVDTRDYTRKKW